MTVHCIFSELGCGFDDATGNWMLDAVFLYLRFSRNFGEEQLLVNSVSFSVDEQTNAGEVRESR